MSDRDICSICRDDLSKAVSLDCSHEFCLGCIQKWAETENTCPVCRADFACIGNIEIKRRRQSDPDFHAFVTDTMIHFIMNDHFKIIFLQIILRDRDEMWRTIVDIMHRAFNDPTFSLLFPLLGDDIEDAKECLEYIRDAMTTTIEEV
jgi:hypothetical protein